VSNDTVKMLAGQTIEDYGTVADRLPQTFGAAAADDEVIVRNPCRIKGAGVESAPERPVIGLAEVLALAAAVPPHYRVLVLLAAFGFHAVGRADGVTAFRH
jgi:hypothetical protein